MKCCPLAVSHVLLQSLPLCPHPAPPLPSFPALSCEFATLDISDSLGTVRRQSNLRAAALTKSGQTGSTLRSNKNVIPALHLLP